ncbi:unnamed protein product [Dovyalis caffra]|uniref:40S ribosomal protein S12 n=1 Tax=Dovyalis caffra TaxID=77055 RepID=A0AAV1S6P9_9ROSI|nr:unnamed protein product [Dovyalis caffra]
MSGEEVAVPQAEIPAVGDAPPLGEPMDLMTALQLVLRKSLAHGGLSRGLHEGAKVIEKHAAQLCVLADDCNQPDYIKLVKALCADHNVNLLTVPSAKTLGEWAGLCKIDSEGKARKVVGCSCVVVKDFGEDSEALNVVQQHRCQAFTRNGMLNVRVTVLDFRALLSKLKSWNSQLKPYKFNVWRDTTGGVGLEVGCRILSYPAKTPVQSLREYFVLFDYIQLVKALSADSSFTM